MKLGKILPDIILKDHLDRDYRLYENLNNWLVLIFLKDYLITEQLLEFNSNYEKIISAGINIIVVNNAPVQTNKALVKKLNFKFPLLSDVEGKLSSVLDSKEKVKRKILILNNNAKIVYVDYKFPTYYLNKIGLVF